MRLNKTYPITYFKALDKAAGTFVAIVSVFGNVDYQGDKVMPGAFAKTLADWKNSGDPIPIIWSHDWANPFAHIGSADAASAEEVLPGQKDDIPPGLLLRGTIDMNKEFAGQVYDLLAERRVKEWSFAYDVVREKIGADKSNELHELKLIEAGPTLKGANPDTVTVGVKSELEQAAQRESDLKLFEAAMGLDPVLAKALAPTAFDRLEKAAQETAAETEAEADGEKDDAAETSTPADDDGEKAEQTEGEGESEGEAEGEGEKSGEKSGRVIGAKRVQDLQSALGAAVTEWAAEVNGELADTGDTSKTQERDPALVKLDEVLRGL